MANNQFDQQSIDARHMALGLSGAWGVFRKLEWEVNAFKEASRTLKERNELVVRDIYVPMYLAINAASTSWSLIEWIWVELQSDAVRRVEFCRMIGAGDRANLNELKDSIRQKLPEIDACNQIAHAAKHRLLKKITPGFTTPVFVDFWVKDGQSYLSMSANTRHEQDGHISEQTLESFLNSIVAQWRHILESLAISDPDIRLVSRVESTDR
jgi:hypothetical protein